MQNIRFKKYTTDFELSLFDGLEVNNTEIENIIDNFENIFSRFKKDSELSQINSDGGGNISPLFLKLLNLNIHLYKLTKGYFNPLVNVEKFGYSGEIIKPKTSNINLEENLILSGDKLKIKNNLKLDFGGSAKGFLVDLISDYLKKKGNKNFIVNFGGDIYVSGNKGDSKFTIGINNPFIPGKNFGYINLEDSSISSSGNYKRNWEISGEKFHHIVNPISGKNENEIVMISIISDKTYFTDAIATSVFNMGIKSGIKFLNENSLSGLIIGADNKAYFTKNFKEKYNFKK